MSQMNYLLIMPRFVDKIGEWYHFPLGGYYGTAVPRFRRSGNRLSGSGNRCSDGVSRLSGAADADTKLLLG